MTLIFVKANAKIPERKDIFCGEFSDDKSSLFMSKLFLVFNKCFPREEMNLKKS